MRIYGVDFTSAPRRAKPITVAACTLVQGSLRVEAIEHLVDFAGFEDLLARPGPWIGGFDFPFGLPRELVRDLGWPTNWRALVSHCARLTREELRNTFDTYRAGRPVGDKYPHRATDLPARSHSPMKLVNPPVALMFHEGARRIAACGAHVPGLAAGDRSRIALEAYPGMLARSVTRASYKNDAKSKQTPAREAARRAIAASLDVEAAPGVRQAMVADASGDTLDAVLCAVQAAGAAGLPDFGLPVRVPRVEGWIIGACSRSTETPPRATATR